MDTKVNVEINYEDLATAEMALAIAVEAVNNNQEKYGVYGDDFAGNINKVIDILKEAGNSLCFK